jgi:hypothetical protein
MGARLVASVLALAGLLHRGNEVERALGAHAARQANGAGPRGPLLTYGLEPRSSFVESAGVGRRAVAGAPEASLRLGDRAAEVLRARGQLPLLGGSPVDDVDVCDARRRPETERHGLGGDERAGALQLGPCPVDDNIRRVEVRLGRGAPGRVRATPGVRGAVGAARRSAASRRSAAAARSTEASRSAAAARASAAARAALSRDFVSHAAVVMPAATASTATTAASHGRALARAAATSTPKMATANGAAREPMSGGASPAPGRGPSPSRRSGR